MARERSFTTAAARRREDPIVWVIDGHRLRLKATVDMAQMADLLEAIQAPTPEGMSEVRAAIVIRDRLVDALRAFVEDDEGAYDAIVADLDQTILTEMLTELLTEYTGAANPTKPPSSSDG